MESTAGGTDGVRQALLLCGIAASLLHVGTDRLAGTLLRGYDFMSHSMGELSAAGAPTRPLVVTLNLLSAALMLAFGVGVWRTAGQALLPRVTAGLVMGQAVAGLVLILFFPDRYGMRPDPASAGVIVGATGVLLLVLAIAFGAAAFGGWFRILSVGILVAYAALAALRFATAGASSAAETVSLVGAQERTMLYVFLAWIIALAVLLLTSGSTTSRTG